ncbi:MAG: cysteine-rich KTR domain-containing protein [Lachnospiraceae bacterium]|nr:cysteine-rich KTR domain-containing protein [Lachnospiraceae bacterium]
MQTIQAQWLLCPVCNHKTRIKLRQDTIIERLPLYCPKCRKEILVNVKQLNIDIIKEPDAQTQSR